MVVLIKSEPTAGPFVSEGNGTVEIHAGLVPSKILFDPA
jgi:hypothetical protein